MKKSEKLKSKGWKQHAKCGTWFKGCYCPTCSEHVFNKQKIIEKIAKEEKQNGF